MPNHDRRAAGRRRAWGRGPTILRFEPLEGRELLSTARPDLVATAFNTVHNLNWGDAFQAAGTIQDRGTGDATAPFRVDVYAAPANDSGDLTRDPGAVKLGSIAIPGGLPAGASTSFNETLRLPANPVPGYDGTSGIKVALAVDPTNAVGEARTTDKQGLGPGVDQSAVVIAPASAPPPLPAGLVAGLAGGAAPAPTPTPTPTPTTAASPAPSTPIPDLVGTGFAVASTSRLAWGGGLDVQARVADNSAGAAPATRARIVLTPAGASPGGAADVTLGNLAIPAIAGGQSAAVTGSVPLPATPPSALAGAAAFTVSMIQDADFRADPVGPHRPMQGAGLDQATVQIASAAASQAPRPDLSPADVKAPAALTWGQTFQVSTTVLNTGPAPAGPVRVRFWLADASGTTANSLFLGDTVISTIKAQVAQGLTQTLALPAAPPANLQLAPGAAGQILVQVDPENAIDEVSKSNNVASSGPITLKLVTADGTTVVPTQASTLAVPRPITTASSTAPGTPLPAGTLKGTSTTSTATAHLTAHQAAAERRAEARAAARQRALNTRLHLRTGHLSIFPKAAGKVR